MPFLAATYNVLATAYLGRGDYSAVPPEVLDPDRRAAALTRHIAGFDADLRCLQEVEADVLAARRAGLEPRGYAGLYEPKARGKPDGSATFFRTSVLSLLKATRLEYRDDEHGPGRHSGF